MRQFASARKLAEIAPSVYLNSIYIKIRPLVRLIRLIIAVSYRRLPATNIGHKRAETGPFSLNDLEVTLLPKNIAKKIYFYLHLWIALELLTPMWILVWKLELRC